MKKSILVLLVLVSTLTSCTTDEYRARYNATETARAEAEANGDAGEMYYGTSNRNNTLEVVRVRDCDYVILHKGYGSDLEHYAGCENPIHNK